jgi:hypothetical protein
MKRGFSKIFPSWYQFLKEGTRKPGVVETLFYP